MQHNREDLIKLILEERERQVNLPGSEWDLRREPNDWLSIAGKYLFEAASTKSQKTIADEYQESLVKAAAVILAALEHVDVMKDDKKLK